jgi:hypothetical protein
MNRQEPSNDSLAKLVNGALIAALVVMAIGFYVRYTSDPDPAWTAFPTPIACLLLGLRSFLLVPDRNSSARTQRIVGGSLMVLSIVLLILNLVQIQGD